MTAAPTDQSEPFHSRAFTGVREQSGIQLRTFSTETQAMTDQSERDRETAWKIVTDVHAATELDLFSLISAALTHARAEGVREGVEALRNPTAEMIGTAGAKVLNQYVGKDPADYPYGTAQWASECFAAMIDAALAEMEGRGADSPAPPATEAEA